MEYSRIQTLTDLEKWLETKGMVAIVRSSEIDSWSSYDARLELVITADLVTIQSSVNDDNNNNNDNTDIAFDRAMGVI